VWTDGGAQKDRIERLKKPLLHKDPAKADPLAFLIVKSMLLTGFDAPIEGVMYLDGPIREAELLQTIARVNLTGHGKKFGIVVDYFGLAHHLDQDPVAYRKLSERLRALLDKLGEQWDGLTKALQGLVDEIRTGPMAHDDRLPELPAQYGPFLRLMIDAAAGDRAMEDVQRKLLVDLTVEVVDTVAAELTMNFGRPYRRPAQAKAGTSANIAVLNNFTVLSPNSLVTRGRGTAGRTRQGAALRKRRSARVGRPALPS
jgi:hypothetical protein